MLLRRLLVFVAVITAVALPAGPAAAACAESSVEVTVTGASRGASTPCVPTPWAALVIVDRGADAEGAATAHATVTVPAPVVRGEPRGF